METPGPSVIASRLAAGAADRNGKSLAALYEELFKTLLLLPGYRSEATAQAIVLVDDALEWREVEL